MLPLLESQFFRLLHGRTVIINQLAINIIFKNVFGSLGLVRQAAASKEASQCGILDQNGLAIVWLILFPLNCIELLYLLLGNPEGYDLKGLCELFKGVNGVKTA